VSDSLVKQLIDSFNEDPLNPDVMIKELYERIDDNQIKHLILTQQKNGSWNDIEYNDNSLSNWAPAKHANNIILLAKGFCFRNSTYYQNQLILDAVHKALKYWFEGNFVCANWWYNQIGVPRILGGAFLLLEPYLTKDELTKAITYMSNAKISMTGQNKIWLAGNVLVNAILRNDTIQFSEAANSIKSEISISNGEGIKSDYSFHQHGAQQQFGNYGLAYINSMTYWAKIFAGTKYAFANDQINVLRSYMLNGMAWIVWKGYMDVSSCGRQLFKNSLRGKSLSFGKSIVNMMQVDPFYKTSYENTYKTDILNSQQLNIKKGFKYFWCSDMAVFRNAKWAATLKMSSSRVIGSEVVNYENINGKLLGDGALYIYQTGKEYNNIFPVWDWSKIPGVTAYESTVTQTNKGWMNYQNKSSFVGGVSDSINGIAVFKHEKDSVHARKSYFFIDNKIVCMGSGINGDDFNFPVTTTINQCIANGAVWFNSNRNWHQLNEAVVAKDIQRVYHDNIVYTFLEKANVFLSCKLQKGSWRQVANMYDTAVEEKKVFKLFIRHPIMQKNNHYAYMIEPSSKLNRFGKNEINDIRILCHNEKVHALALNKNKEYFISFFDPSSIRLSNRQYLKVSEPCILMLEEKPDKKYVLSLAEPTQQIHSLVIELSGRFYCSEAMSEQQGDVTVLKVDLKENYGKTLQLHLSVLE
jgi:chondroitin AC lyase